MSQCSRATTADTTAIPLRDAICWSHLVGDERQGLASCGGACDRLHLVDASGNPLCGRHVTATLNMWGRRRRPLCDGSRCGREHGSLVSVLEAVAAASRRCNGTLSGMRVEISTRGIAATAPLLGEARTTAVAHAAGDYYVVPADISSELATRAIAAQQPLRLRVAIDAAYDHAMDLRERKSLATQITLCHGLASEPAHRGHTAIAVCSLTGAPAARDRAAVSAEADAPPLPEASSAVGSTGGASAGATTLANYPVGAATCGREAEGAESASTLPLLVAAGLGTWNLPYTADDPRCLHGAAGRLVYLSPDAPEALEDVSEDDIYIIGGLIDRKYKVAGASLSRAAALGARAARLPLLESLPPEQRTRTDSLDMLNVNAVFRILVEYATCRSWPTALRTALEATQRGYVDPEKLKKPRNRGKPAAGHPVKAVDQSM